MLETRRCIAVILIVDIIRDGPYRRAFYSSQPVLLYSVFRMASQHRVKGVIVAGGIISMLGAIGRSFFSCTVSESVSVST